MFSMVLRKTSRGASYTALMWDPREARLFLRNSEFPCLPKVTQSFEALSFVNNNNVSDTVHISWSFSHTGTFLRQLLFKAKGAAAFEYPSALAHCYYLLSSETAVCIEWTLEHPTRSKMQFRGHFATT